VYRYTSPVVDHKDASILNNSCRSNFASCTTDTQTGKTTLEHWTDTIYSSSMRNDPNFYRLTVQITDTTELENPVFEIEKEQAIKVKVWEFDEYPISIKAKDNVKITEQDSKNGILNSSLLTQALPLKFGRTMEPIMCFEN
jgi:hypothetical protein